MDTVKAHEQSEDMEFVEVIPEHVVRKEASQAEFDAAKKLLIKLYGGKRCIVCELRGEKPTDHEGNHIESHHIFEWCHWNDNNMQMVETVLRALSPFIHGLYLMSKEDILSGKPVPSLWDHPHFKDKPFKSLDDPRNQFFICHAHHQQMSVDDYDVVGLHHIPFPVWLQYLGTDKDKNPVHHANKHHDHGLDMQV